MLFYIFIIKHMANTIQLSTVLKTIYKTKWKEISVPVILEFIVAFIGDFMEPKYNIIRAIFFIFLIVLGFCIYKIYQWHKQKKEELASPELIFDKQQGLSESITKGMALSTFGVLISTAFIVFQMATGNTGNGAIASIVPELQPLQNTLLSMDKKLDDISNKLDNVKKETSDDARKELQNIGVSWNGENFLNAVKDGDKRVAVLFLQAGMRSETAKSEGRTLPIMLALNTFNPDEMLDLLLDYKLDINYVYEQYGAFGNMKATLLGSAIERGNVKLVKALLKRKVNISNPYETFGSMGISRGTYPLASAIYWKQPEIVMLLLDNKADVSAGDYAAYQQMYADKDNYFWKKLPNEVAVILKKTAPKGRDADKITNEARLKEIDKELVELAKKSFQSYSNSYNKRKYDRQYDSLQVVKKELLEKMK